MIRAIIVDDEEPSIVKMEKLSLDSGLVEIKGKFTQPYTALEFLKKNQIDAAFLDIEMPDMDGIELANRISDIQERVAVIFVTAYNQYAVEAFRLNALDYLMKPVTADRLKDTLNRIIAEKEIRMQTAILRIQCFGKFKVTGDTVEVKFRTEKAKELLAFLIDRRGEFVHRNEICDNLWEEYDGDRALIHFNTTLYYVKKALLHQGVVIQIEHDKGNYRLKFDGLDCDYQRFVEFTTKIGRADQSNISKFEELIGAYRGDYMAGMEFGWAEHNRQMLKERLVMMVLQVSAYYKAAGDLPKTIDWLKQGLIQEPLHRELNYRLIETLLSVNDRISAGKYYEIYRNELDRKLRQEADEDFKKLLG